MPPKTEPELERLFHLVLSKEEVTVMLLGMIAVDGLVRGDPHSSVVNMALEYVKVKLTTNADIEGALDRLHDKVVKITEAEIERRKSAGKPS